MKLCIYLIINVDIQGQKMQWDAMNSWGGGVKKY